MVVVVVSWLFGILHYVVQSSRTLIFVFIFIFEFMDVVCELIAQSLCSHCFSLTLLWGLLGLKISPFQEQWSRAAQALHLQLIACCRYQTAAEISIDFQANVVRYARIITAVALHTVSYAPWNPPPLMMMTMHHHHRSGTCPMTSGSSRPTKNWGAWQAG